MEKNLRKLTKFIESIAIKTRLQLFKTKRKQLNKIVLQITSGLPSKIHILCAVIIKIDAMIAW